MTDLERAVGKLAGHGVLVIGDVMLDHFLVGRVTRISPEAPVPVVEFDREEFRLGGAANVAHAVQALGGHARVVGTAGTDESGDRLRAHLQQCQIDTDGVVVDPGRRTTTKLRIVTDRSQQVARVDFESEVDVTGATEERLIERIDAALGHVAAVLVSDYLKGVVTRAIMRHVIAGGRAARIPVLVDPKIPHIEYYAGATLVKPNHVEAETATHTRIRTDDDTRRAAQAFRQLVDCESVLVTRGEHGMYLLEGRSTTGSEDPAWTSVREQHFPAASREVADVTGAGDTVIGTMALALASGATLADAAHLANHAAGIAVSRFGPVPVTAQELRDTITDHSTG